MVDTEFLKIYWQQYILLEKRMIELSDYVSIHPRNFSVFSNQFISMYLTICSEVDSVADEFCKMIGIEEKQRYGINNKINIILNKYDNIRSWRCATKFPNEEINIVPFAKFSVDKSADWWQAYNNVKHKRTELNGQQYNYELANLKNILFALAALYLLLYKIREEAAKDFPLDFESQLFDICCV